ncbi:MAG: T9SS type A sorting domain-containing protein [Bacteroidia bacterium]|nr:T9SS type A sorting domain-containing protein [Bacteroidia bacterium]
MKRVITLLFAILLTVQAVRAGEIRFEIVPNPASSSVRIHLNQNSAENTRVEVFTMLGTRVSTATPQILGNGDLLLNVSALPEGVYLIRVTESGNSAVKRLRVQHT